MKIRSYTELREIEDFEERYEYLALNGAVGAKTFGFDRHLNQRFYTSRAWRQARSAVIIRDRGCDLGVDGYEIHSGLVIHHMNPMTIEDLSEFNPSTMDPEFLITTTHDTHNAIHYGDRSLLVRPMVERKPGDTKLW
jgi:hypothetical protein